MNKKSKIAKSSWWIFAIIGIIVHLSILDFEDKWVLALIGALNGAFWGWLLGLLLDYIINSLFYREPIEEKTQTISKPKPIVKKTINHNDFKPKPSEYTTIKKEIEPKIVAEPIAVYETKPKLKTEPKPTPPKLKQTERPKKQEILPTSVQDTSEVVSEIKFVNYNLKLSESETEFPILKIPNQKCVIRSHRLGSTKRRGFKETSFQKAIEYYFAENFNISGNLRLNTGKNTRPYEPDIALIGFDDHNIQIDVEIDEPYAGITRQPTHCIGDDINRDNYFKDRGWIVIRFSEYQIHTQEKECLRYIADIISSVNSSIEIPSDLKFTSKINVEKVWDVVQSQKWEKEKYREKYLNHEFKNLETPPETLKRDFSEQEIEEEKLVVPTSFGKEEIGKIIGFNSNNINDRDKRIKFYSEKHIYTIDGVTFPSASTIVGRFFQEFDAWGIASRLSPSNPLYGLEVEEIVRIWKERGQDAANLGTFLHEQIESFYLNQPYEQTEEFYQFENFVSDHPNLNPYRSEWRIFDDNIGVAGTIDLIVKNQQNFDIYDWKRSKKVINTFDGKPIETDNWGKCGIGQLSHIDDTSYNRYCLQQSLYKFVLEKNYKIKVDNMYLIVMYPEYDNYYKVKVPYLKKEIEHILKTV
ncbi:hypothetical protein [Nonlabens sp. Asnod3-A02]|uniref:hypothetical protein n=1 Tax=Nonlabens sp. Asnod3-A02 TaxID=3160579 RepID=UPI00386F287D